MALIKCPECGKEISDTSDKCVNCGYVLNHSAKHEKKESGNGSLGNISIAFAFLIPLVGFIIGIVGACKREKNSVYGIVLSILMPIFYALLWVNVISPKLGISEYNYAPSYEYDIDDIDDMDDDYDLDDYDLDLEDY